MTRTVSERIALIDDELSRLPEGVPGLEARRQTLLREREALVSEQTERKQADG